MITKVYHGLQDGSRIRQTNGGTGQFGFPKTAVQHATKHGGPSGQDKAIGGDDQLRTVVVVVVVVVVVDIR